MILEENNTMYKNFREMNEEDKVNLMEAMYQNLIMIRDIGFDYDGYSKAEDLKELIDELVKYAKNGLKGERPQFIGKNGAVQEYKDGKFSVVPEEKWNENARKFSLHR